MSGIRDCPAEIERCNDLMVTPNHVMTRGEIMSRGNPMACVDMNSCEEKLTRNDLVTRTMTCVMTTYERSKSVGKQSRKTLRRLVEQLKIWEKTPGRYMAPNHDTVVPSSVISILTLSLIHI